MSKKKSYSRLIASVRAERSPGKEHAEVFFFCPTVDLGKEGGRAYETAYRRII